MEHQLSVVLWPKACCNDISITREALSPAIALQRFRCCRCRRLIRLKEDESGSSWIRPPAESGGGRRRRRRPTTNSSPRDRSTAVSKQTNSALHVSQAHPRLAELPKTFRSQADTGRERTQRSIRQARNTFEMRLGSNRLYPNLTGICNYVCPVPREQRSSVWDRMATTILMLLMPAGGQSSDRYIDHLTGWWLWTEAYIFAGHIV